MKPVEEFIQSHILIYVICKEFNTFRIVAWRNKKKKRTKIERCHDFNTIIYDFIRSENEIQMRSVRALKRKIE